MPTTFELNGHRYELVECSYTWWGVKEEAEKKGGHLVTINSQEEYDKVCQLAEQNGMVFVWLGAKRSDWEGGVWNTGEGFDFAPWLSGEPSGGDEEYLCMLDTRDGWLYNDVTDEVTDYSGKRCYIVEYE